MAAADATATISIASRESRDEWLDRNSGRIMVLPAVVILLAFAIFPLIISIYLSLCRFALAGGSFTLTFSEPILDGRDAIPRCLDDQLPFEIPFDGPLPAIERRHRREQVDAGGQALIDQRACDHLAAVVGGDGRQDQDDVSHSEYVRIEEFRLKS